MSLPERWASALEGLEAREEESADGMPTLAVAREELLELARRFRDALGFGMATIVTALDLYPEEPRFRVVHQLLSLEHNERVRFHTAVEEHDAVVPSVSGLWPGAGFFEREAYDMFGIRFDGHPELKRLLMPESYEHHPLRKDFPHQGIEPDRLYREWDKKRREAAEQA